MGAEIRELEGGRFEVYERFGGSGVTLDTFADREAAEEYLESVNQSDALQQVVEEAIDELIGEYGENEVREAIQVWLQTS